MIITIASYKGGVGKTTTAIHLAAYFHRFAPTLLIDKDIIRASTKWSQRGDGKGFPFKVVDESQTAKYAREYVHGHIIIDTEANPSTLDFRQVADGCDLLVIPAVPETTATDGLTFTLAKLQEIGNDRYRVLLTKVPPKPRTDGEQLRAMLAQNDIPVFAAEVPNLVAFDKASAEGVLVAAVHDARAKRGWKATKPQERKSIMAERQKYSAIAALREARQQSEAPAPATGLRLPVKPPKPQGKRSDPDWKQYSVLLKKESHKQASLLLRQKYEGIDISDLMQALLEQWLETEQ